MGIYEARPAMKGPADLNQGDIVSRVMRAVEPTGKNLVVKKGQNETIWPVPNGRTPAEGQLDPQLRLQLQVERVELAIVISNSCDNVRNHLTLAPIRPFEFKGPAQTAKQRWGEIRLLATGSGSPKTFYLPALPNVLQRSTAELGEYFRQSHDLMSESIKRFQSARVTGLTPEAVRHLQWHWSLVSSRNSREDFDWQGGDDLALRLDSVKEELGHGPSDERKAELETEQKLLEEQLAKEVAAPAPPVPAGA